MNGKDGGAELRPRGLEEMEKDGWRGGLRLWRRKEGPSHLVEQSRKCQSRYVSTGFSLPNDLLSGEPF